MNDLVWHFWIGNANIHTKYQEVILCFSYDPSLLTKTIREAAPNDKINATMIKSGVTCQECLELIHA